MKLKVNTIIVCKTLKEFINIQLILNFYKYYHPYFKNNIKKEITGYSFLYIQILADNEFYFISKESFNKKYTYLSYENFLKMDV